jgi:hypothetical protein
MFCRKCYNWLLLLLPFKYALQHVSKHRHILIKQAIHHALKAYHTPTFTLCNGSCWMAFEVFHSIIHTFCILMCQVRKRSNNVNRACFVSDHMQLPDMTAHCTANICSVVSMYEFCLFRSFYLEVWIHYSCNEVCDTTVRYLNHILHNKENVQTMHWEVHLWMPTSHLYLNLWTSGG